MCKTLRFARTGILLCIGLWASAYAQNVTVSGMVADFSTRQPLGGVTLRISPVGAGGFSGDDGRFTFSFDATGRDSLTLTANLLDYATQSQRFAIKAGQDYRFELYLVPDNYAAEDVVITAARGFEQRQADVTVSIEVVKQDAINLQSSPSLDRVITQIPGVDNLDNQINIRGSSGYAYGVGSRVMVMLDGLPLLSGDAGNAELSLIPVDNISQIEVIKGASSVLYGSGSVGGVINVITADPGEKPTTSIRLRGAVLGSPANRALDWNGSQNTYQASTHIFHSRRIGGLNLTLQTDLIKDQGYRQGTDKEELRALLLTRYRPKNISGLSFGLNTSIRIDSSGGSLYWRGYHPDTTVQIIDGVEQTVVSGGALTPTDEPGATRKQLNSRFALDPYIKFLSDNGQLFWYRGRYLANTNVNNTGQSARNYIFYNDLMYQRTVLKKFNWVSGMTYTFAQANADSLYEGVKRGNFFGVYSQLDGKIGRLNTNLGFRMETAQIDTLKRETRPVLRIGLNYELREGLNVRASFGQAFRVPSVAERYANTTGGGILVSPNPNLKSEYGYSGEIGIRQGFRFGMQERNTKGYVDVAAFVTDFNNMVEFGLQKVDIDFGPPLGFIANFASANVARARITGAELTTGITGRRDDWSFNLWGGVTFLNPQNLKAVAPERQIQLEGFQDDLASGDLGRIFNALNTILDTTANRKIDNPEYLKYRSRWLLRGSGSLGWKNFSLTCNYRYRSRMLAIDQYLYLVVDDLNYFYTQVQPGGIHITDFIGAWRFWNNHELSLNVSNAFNREFDIIPGTLGEQRKFTLQYLARF